jgi:hypothetical protein
MTYSIILFYFLLREGRWGRGTVRESGIERDREGQGGETERETERERERERER